MITNVDISRKQGNTRRIVFHLTDNEGDIDVSNFSNFKLSVNPLKYPKDNLKTVEEMSGYILDGLTGRVGFTPSGNIIVGEYFFDAILTDDNGELFTFVEGHYSVTGGVSK